MREKIAIFLEGIGIGTTLSGIGYVLISLGSLFVALGAVTWKKLK